MNDMAVQYIKESKMFNFTLGKLHVYLNIPVNIIIMNNIIIMYTCKYMYM